MRNILFKRLYPGAATLLILLALLRMAAPLQAETVTLGRCSFETEGDTWGYLVTPSSYNISNDIWGIQSSLPGIALPADGSYFWGMRDLNNPNGGGNFYHTIRFSPVSLSGYQGAQLSLRYVSYGFETSDSMRYSVAYDNGTDWGDFIELPKNSSWQIRTITPPSNADYIRISLETILDGDSDAAAWDNVILTAVPSGSAAPPTITPAEVSDISSVSATLSAIISSTNGTVVTERGFYYSSDGGFIPPDEGIKLSETGNFGNGEYSMEVTSLIPESSYYCTSFARNSTGTRYGSEVPFTTSRLSAPGSITIPFTNHTCFSASWDAVPGASSYIIDVAESPLFRSGEYPLFISEVADPQDISDARFVELYNNSDASQGLNGWKLVRQANGEFRADIPLNGSIAPYSTFVIAQRDEVFSNSYPVASADLIHGFITGSGNDAYFLYYGESLIDIYGVADEDGNGCEWEYTDSRAERLPVTGQGQPLWIKEQWRITAETTTGMTPGTHVCTMPLTRDFVPGYCALDIGNTTGCTVTGLTPGKSYYFRIRSLSPTGSSDFSPENEITTVPFPHESIILLR